VVRDAIVLGAGAQPLHLTLQRDNRLLRDADHRAQVVVGYGEGSGAALVTMLACGHRLCVLGQILGEPAQRRVQHQRPPGAVAILRIHVCSHLLQVQHQPRLEFRDRRHVIPDRGNRRFRRLLGLALGVRGAIQVIDEL